MEYKQRMDLKPWRYGYVLRGISCGLSGVADLKTIDRNYRKAGGYEAVQTNAQVTADKAILKMMAGD